MTCRRFTTFAALVSLLSASLSACGGSGGSLSGSTGTSPPPPPPPATAGCTLRERQDWAAAQLREWYLFPETLPVSLNPAGYSSVEDYVDALTANARAQGRDRFFTYLTSIAEENPFYNSGASAGFGVRLTYDTAARRVIGAEAVEGTTAPRAR